MTSDQVGCKEGDCAGLGPNGCFCYACLTESSQHLELLWADSLSDTHATLNVLKHLTLGCSKRMTISVLRGTLDKVSERDDNSKHIWRRVIKSLDLRAVRFGNFLLNLLNCIDESLGLGVLHLLLKRT